MTQRVFDADNPQEIFDLFPDDVVRIKKSVIVGCWASYKDGGEADNFYVPLKINWRGKTEITRPVDESQLIGKLCWFTGSGATCEYIGVLKAIVKNRSDKYQMKNGGFYSYCRPVRRDEVQFVEDTESKE